MSPGNPIEVWWGIGDSEEAGRGNVPGSYPVGYPASAAGSVWMIRNNGLIVPLGEPTGDDGSGGLGDSPLGFWAAARAARTGKKIIIVNNGKGSSRASQWVPGGGLSYYEQGRDKVRTALRQPGTDFKGSIFYGGLNDALDAVNTWGANMAIVKSAIDTDFGVRPAYGIRYPATVPTDSSYPSHASIRAEHLTTPVFSGVVSAPEGPWVEGPVLAIHLQTSANVVVGTLLDGAIP